MPRRWRGTREIPASISRPSPQRFITGLPVLLAKRKEKTMRTSRDISRLLAVGTLLLGVSLLTASCTDSDSSETAEGDDENVGESLDNNTNPPVIGNARCNDKIRLRSWKGDYLHRPAGGGVTTSSSGDWTVRCNANGSISLQSWAGDYLHRPNSPQGVTMWSNGDWTVEPVSGTKIGLKSWKGDYLHRPDSPQGVTTWSNGTWDVEMVCPVGQMSINGGACTLPPTGPVMGNAKCNDQIRLRSWKGDYLHRPAGGGVTTWNSGDWTVRCNANGSISLQSWAGDYLHRPDSPQGVTMWSFGDWTVEPVSGPNIMLKSWKGDYLHRPDGPQGVTTWSNGTWMVEPVCPAGQVSINGGLCIVPTRAQLAQRYAPKVWMAAGEQFFPSAVEDFLPNVENQVVGGKQYLVTKQSLGGNDSTDPPFLVGRDPTQSTAPMYAAIVERTQNGQPTNVTDIIYWMFYPYNRGKSVCIGPFFDNYCPFYCPFTDSCCVPRISGCSTTYKRFGNHVGDWEHVTIRFINGVPTQVALSQHAAGQVFNYDDPALTRSADRIVVYSALGSHGLYADAARHTYGSVPGGDTLNDDTSAGKLWDAEASLVTFNPQAVPFPSSLAWLNYPGYWGNPEGGCDVFGIPIDYCTLEGGPSPILPRDIMQPALKPID